MKGLMLNFVQLSLSEYRKEIQRNPMMMSKEGLLYCFILNDVYTYYKLNENDAVCVMITFLLCTMKISLDKMSKTQFLCCLMKSDGFFKMMTHQRFTDIFRISIQKD